MRRVTFPIQEYSKTSFCVRTRNWWRHWVVWRTGGKTEDVWTAAKELPHFMRLQRAQFLNNPPVQQVWLKLQANIATDGREKLLTLDKTLSRCCLLECDVNFHPTARRQIPEDNITLRTLLSSSYFLLKRWNSSVGNETDYSPLSSTKVRNMWICTSKSPYISMT
jgi:hypothetical protein